MCNPLNVDVLPDSIVSPDPRAAILSSIQLGLTILPDLCTRDCVVATAKLGGQSIIFASLYFDINLPVSQSCFQKLMRFAGDQGMPIIIGADSNCHSTLFGPDQNKRGDELDEWISEHCLSIANNRHTPTFRRTGAKSCIDVTLFRDVTG